MLVLKRGQIPPSLHFENPSPHIDMPGLKLRVPTTLEAFPDNGARRIAGVNSFGFGGANAHVILAEPPAQCAQAHADDFPMNRSWPLVISARSEDALKATAARLGDWIESHELGNGTSPVLPKLTYTLGARRNHHQHRLTVVASSSTELTEELREFAAGNPVSKARSSFTPRPEFAPRIGFVMSGQGPQWWGMGRELMRNEPVFREMMEACEAAMRPYASFSLLEELGRDEADSKMQQTEIAQPAIFAMQLALVALWKSLGVEPTAVVGHSVGEVAAACVAGILSLEEAARVIVLRARFMHECARGEGTMLAVSLSEEEARGVDRPPRHDGEHRGVQRPAFADLGRGEILARSDPRRAGAAEYFRPLRESGPPVSPRDDATGGGPPEQGPRRHFRRRKKRCRFSRTVTGERCAGKDCVAAHWGRGIRQSVQFVKAVNAVADFGVDVWLEISSHPALSMSITECLTARGMKAQVTASTRRDREHESFLEAALDLHRGGVVLDFSGDDSVARTPLAACLSVGPSPLVARVRRTARRPPLPRRKRPARRPPTARHADLDDAPRQPPHGVPQGPQGRYARHFPGRWLCGNGAGGRCAIVRRSPVRDRGFRNPPPADSAGTCFRR